MPLSQSLSILEICFLTQVLSMIILYVGNNICRFALCPPPCKQRPCPNYVCTPLFYVVMQYIYNRGILFVHIIKYGHCYLNWYTAKISTPRDTCPHSPSPSVFKTYQYIIRECARERSLVPLHYGAILFVSNNTISTKRIIIYTCIAGGVYYRVGW